MNCKPEDFRYIPESKNVPRNIIFPYMVYAHSQNQTIDPHYAVHLVPNGGNEDFKVFFSYDNNILYLADDETILHSTINIPKRLGGKVTELCRKVTNKDISLNYFFVQLNNILDSCFPIHVETTKFLMVETFDLHSPLSDDLVFNVENKRVNLSRRRKFNNKEFIFSLPFEVDRRLLTSMFYDRVPPHKDTDIDWEAVIQLCRVISNDKAGTDFNPDILLRLLSNMGFGITIHQIYAHHDKMEKEKIIGLINEKLGKIFATKKTVANKTIKKAVKKTLKRVVKKAPSKAKKVMINKTVKTTKNPLVNLKPKTSKLKFNNGK